VRFPNSLRALYSDGDGRYDDGGQWWVVWPIDQLVAENETYWQRVVGDELIMNCMLGRSRRKIFVAR
jgi:hypothetical protein